MNFRVVFAIFQKDFYEGLKNHQILLMLATPIALSLLFSHLYTDSKSKALLPKVGIIGKNHPLLAQFSPEKFGAKIVFFKNRTLLEEKILEGEVSFGLIITKLLDFEHIIQGKVSQISLLYPAEVPDYMIERMRYTLDHEIRRYINKPIPSSPVEIRLEAVGENKTEENSFSNDFFPMWILMTLGMIGFLAVPISFVEEKENRTLHALLLTPMTSGELILGKSLFGFCLAITTILTMVILNHRWQGSQFFFWAFVFLGAFQCLFIGLLISLFAESQASVNAIGTTIFLVFQMVPNLYRTSDLLKYIAPFVPSFYISRGVKKALFLNLEKVNIFNDFWAVLAITLVSYLVVFFCLRYKRYRL